MRATSRRDENTRAPLVGNRLMLIGAVLYLLEWVAIIAGDVSVPLGGDASGHTLMTSYSGHADRLGWAAGWFSIVLLGRILIMVGLRTCLRDSGRPQPLMDLAVLAMTVSVTLEIATYAIPAGTAWALGHGSGLAVTRALDSVSFTMNSMVWGPIAVSMLCAGIAMWRARLFPWPLWALALLSGVSGLFVAGVLAEPSQSDVADAVTSVTALSFWVWMLWGGVLLVLRTPSRASRSPEMSAGQLSS